MNKAALSMAFLSVACATAQAMTFSNAGENLFYLQHAKVSADHCEKLGFTVQPALLVWQDKHRLLFTETIAVFRLEGKKRGLSPAQQDEVLGQAMANHRVGAQEHIAKKGVDCKNFAGVLGMYDALLKR